MIESSQYRCYHGGVEDEEEGVGVVVEIAFLKICKYVLYVYLTFKNLTVSLIGADTPLNLIPINNVTNKITKKQRNLIGFQGETSFLRDN